MAIATLIKEDIQLGWLTVQNLRPLPSWWETWQHVCQHGKKELKILYLDPLAARRVRFWAELDLSI